jgi:hypothetical protein
LILVSLNAGYVSNSALVKGRRIVVRDADEGRRPRIILAGKDSIERRRERASPQFRIARRILHLSIGIMPLTG